jgi:type I restriction enzyme R subunit
MAKPNQNPEQKARDNIDTMLAEAGWRVQDNKHVDFNAGLGIAVREFQTDIGPADYALFVDRKAVGIIEAKPEDWGHRITTVEEQSASYAGAQLKWVKNKQPLPFAYESTGVVTRFTDARDPKPRSREVFNFHRPETIQGWMQQGSSLRTRLQTIPPLNPQGLRDCQVSAIENLEKSFKDDRPRALTRRGALDDGPRSRRERNQSLSHRPLIGDVGDGENSKPKCFLAVRGRRLSATFFVQPPQFGRVGPRM